jgi:transposase-like protein
MGRPDRERLKGWVEVDETLVGGWEEGVAGRQTESKILVVIAAEADGPGIGRIRMGVVEDASAASLHPFVQNCVEPGSLLHTDGWQGYSGLDQKGYQREVTVLRGRRKEASRLMPRVHRIAGLLKRWLLGTHQGAVAPQHLSYYLDEFTFRFNRRRSKSRGKLFFRLMQQAVGTSPKTYDTLIGGTKTAKRAAQQVGVW